MRKKFRRVRKGRVLGGICNGISAYTGISLFFIRLIFFFFLAPLFWLYIVIWFILPAVDQPYEIFEEDDLDLYEDDYYDDDNYEDDDYIENKRYYAQNDDDEY